MTGFLLLAANGLTLNTLFVNSTKLQEYLIEQYKLSPVWVEATFDTIIDPTKVRLNRIWL